MSYRFNMTMEINSADVAAIREAMNLANHIATLSAQDAHGSFAYEAAIRCHDILYEHVVRKYDIMVGQELQAIRNRKETPPPESEISGDDIDRCKILYDKGYNYDVIATHLAEWRGIKIESAVRQLKRYGMPPRRAKRKMRRT